MPIKLKNILKENLSIEEDLQLTKEQKRKIRETFRQYNIYRENLKMERLHNSIREIYEAVKLAEKYAINESKEWMEAKMVKEDFSAMMKEVNSMIKESEKLQESEKMLEMLYERLGHKLQRYFEIKDLT